MARQVQFSYSRGHKIIYINHEWTYEDSGERVDHEDLRPCARCSKEPDKEGYDVCLGKIPDAISACCGHGAQGYVIMKDSPGIRRLT